MQEIILTPGGAKVLRLMIVSCGTAGCFEAVKKLALVKSPVPLTEVGLDDQGHWHMAAFSRLKDFAVKEGLTTLDTYEVAQYFGGPDHIAIMERISDHAGLGQYLGPHVGLVTHILLPLTDGVYQNGDLQVSFRRSLALNPDDPGVPCYHLGVIANIELTPDQVETILTAQRESASFARAVSLVREPIDPPEEYYQALTCTADKAKS